MSSAEYDLVVVGDCGVDVYASVPRLPQHDEKIPGEFLGMHGGGVAANFACAAGRLGARTALVATVGKDAFGALAVDSVASFGVDVDHVVRLDEVTAFCFVALDGTGEKALTIVRTPTFFPGAEHVDTSVLERARAVHIAPFDLEVATSIAEVARAAGAAVTVDLEPAMAGPGLDAVEPLLRHSTLLMPNELCMELLFGSGDVRAGAERFLELGPEAVVVTQGRDGALVVDHTGAHRVPAVPVEVRDTTGAGDCFNAALVTSWLQGVPVVEAAAFAAAAASLSIMHVGARDGLPTREDIVAFREDADTGPTR